jgi:hypothetical protein
MPGIWLIHAKDYPTAVGQWGDSVTIDMTALLPNPAISSLRVRKAQVPFIPWNIVTDNQTVTIAVGGIDYAAAVDVGYYSGSDLITALVGAINTALAATTFSVDIAWDTIDFTVNIQMTDSSVPGLAPFTMTTTTTADISPSILTMLGFGTDPLVSVGGDETSSGALNVETDRYLLITCDQAKGKRGPLYSLSTNAWHDGLVGYIPIPDQVNPGQVIAYKPKRSESPWIELVQEATANAITFHLCRNDYQYMGGGQINWMMLLEYRP